MPQSKQLANTTAVMRRIESALASVEELPAKQQKFVMDWARNTYFADEAEAALTGNETADA